MSRAARVCAHGSTEAKCYVCRTFALEARVEALETFVAAYDRWFAEIVCAAYDHKPRPVAAVELSDARAALDAQSTERK